MPGNVEPAAKMKIVFTVFSPLIIYGDRDSMKTVRLDGMLPIVWAVGYDHGSDTKIIELQSLVLTLLLPSLTLLLVRPNHLPDE